MSSAINTAQREKILAALNAFTDTSLSKAASQLLNALGYTSEKTADLGSSAEALLANIEQYKPELGNISRDKIKADRWKSCAFLFQLTNDEIPSLSLPSPAGGITSDLAGVVGQPSRMASSSIRGAGGEGIARSLIESFVFLAIELQGESWSRTDLAAIARELNRRFPMPAIILFKHGLPSPVSPERAASLPLSAGMPLAGTGGGAGGEGVSIVVIDRRANLKDATKDVIDSRITVIKDVRIANPHRAHLDILAGLALENLGDKRRPTNFRELYEAWITALSIQALNKRFYTELAYWYFWAVKQVAFPLGGGEDESKRNSVAVIRLLTRLIFAWFIKEKGLIPEDLFEPAQLKTLLKSDPAANGEDSTYYLAILQNLFFASLNVEMGADRKWAADGGGMKGDRLIHSLYRHKDMFRDPDHALKECFSKIPFLNGGLFECLDRELTERDFQRNPELKALAVKEGNGYVLRVDGFSRRKDAQPIVPNKIFFGGEAQADLNDDLGTKGKRFDVYGLIDIFGRYKFTVEENTPVEEEVALDPELLGKVFENLLASYNEDTQATARKQSGSFYTPREVVDYMVDEALIAYFERYLHPSPASGRGAGGEGLGVRADAQPPLPHSPAKLPDDIRRYARELRTSQTDAESLLWHLLRNRHFLDLKFRRQHPEGRYILDFYCDELKLAIELDGSQHIDQADYDQARTEFLAKQGIRVLRFWNNQVLAETEGVLEAIYQAVMEMQAPSPPAPLPLAGEGSAIARGEGGRTGAACSAPLAGGGSDTDLRRLLSYSTESNDFSLTETTNLIAAIESLKILDPACGSGAFPMGVLQKLVHVLKKLDPSNELWKAQNRAPLAAQLAEAKKIPDPSLRETKVEEAESALTKYDLDFANAKHADYTRKLYLIEKCIHGVDIQPIAVQIAKLRFFIALVVSQEVDKSKDNWGITALPNLETKIVAADSLTPIREVKAGMTENFQLGYDAIKAIEADLHDASERYFSARTTKTKRKYREVIQGLRDKLAGELEQSGFSTAKAQQLVHWNPFDQNAAADFFDPEWMFQLAEGFDITIGNPPYVRQEEIKHLKDNFKAHYDCYTGTADLYVYFYERSIKLLKPHGAFAFITSNKWYRAKYGEKLRDWMNCNTRLRRIIDFGDEAVFTAIAYPTIVIATRRAQPLLPSPASGRGAGGEGAGGGKGRGEDENVLALNWTQEHPVEQFPQVFAQAAFPVPQAELSKDGWQLEPPLKRRLLERIRAAGKPLGEWCGGRFYRGILTGLNEAFVIDGATRARLIFEDPQSAEIIKPYLRGRDVKRWQVEFSDQYLIKIESSENVPHPWSGKPAAEAEKVFAKCYLAIHSHFQNYRQAMIDRTDQGHFFWELRSCAYWHEFEQPKIVYPDIALSPQFAWDNNHRYMANTAYIIPGVEQWLLTILNSPICAWFYGQISPQIQNGYYRFIAQYCEQIPIPVAKVSYTAILNGLVSSVLAGVVEAPRFEQLINGLVFELFFPEDLHRANIHLFDACEKAGIAKLATLNGKALTEAANDLATRIFATSHPIYAMLFDLQGLEVVRIIEGRE